MASLEDDDRPAPHGSEIRSLISDYRAQREAWRAKAQDLARMRDSLRVAAGREAQTIVASAQREVAHLLDRAQADLAALTEQVEALGEPADEAPPEGRAPREPADADDRVNILLEVEAILQAALREVRGVGDEAHTGLAALSARAADLRVHDEPDAGAGARQGPEAAADAAAPSEGQSQADAQTEARETPVEPASLEELQVGVETPPAEGIPPRERREYELLVEELRPAETVASPTEAAAAPDAAAGEALGRVDLETLAVDAVPFPTSRDPAKPVDDLRVPAPMHEVAPALPEHRDEAPVVLEKGPRDIAPARLDWPSPATVYARLTTEPAAAAQPREVSRPALETRPLGRAPGRDPVWPSSIPAIAEPELFPASAPASPLPRSLRTVVATFVVAGAVILAGTGWWLWRSGAVDRQPADAALAASPAASPAPDTTSSRTGEPAASAARAAALPAPRSSVAVRLEVTRTAWIRVTVDGRVVAAREFEPRGSEVFTGAKEVLVRAGDAGAVRIAVNDGDPITLGRDGQAVTRRFALDDSPTPASPASALMAAATPAPGGAVGTSGTVTTPPSASGAGTTTAAGTIADRPPAAPPLSPPAAASGSPAAAPAGTAASAARGAADASAGIPASAASGVGATEDPLALEKQFVRAATRWFEAYHRQDRAAMAAFSSGQPTVSDERSDAERMPRSVPGVRRTFQDVHLQVITESAVFTTRMTERFDEPGTGRTRESESFVSQLWTRRAGVWQLEDVRVVAAARLNQTFR
jgi:hypothetical protein